METHEVNRTLDAVNRLANEALAQIAISTRVVEAHDYCQEYLMPIAWGQNVWHAILDDAIRLRKKYEAGSLSQTKET